jgi:hypothetical protein
VPAAPLPQQQQQQPPPPPQPQLPPEQVQLPHVPCADDILYPGQPPGGVTAWRDLTGDYVHSWMDHVRLYFIECNLRKKGSKRGRLPPAQLWQGWGRAVWANEQLQQEWFNKLYTQDCCASLPRAVVDAIHHEALKDGYMEPPRAEDEYV